jgi:hypothetical protein
MGQNIDADEAKTPHQGPRPLPQPRAQPCDRELSFLRGFPCWQGMGLQKNAVQDLSRWHSRRGQECALTQGALEGEALVCSDRRSSAICSAHKIRKECR